MHILKSIKRVPGGLMLVPLLLGAICHTCAPWAGEYFGSFTNGLITGTTPILSVWFFCMGTSINYRSVGMILRKSGSIVLTKIVMAWIAGFLCMYFIPSGVVQTGFFAGLSTLAIVTSMDMTNSGLYVSLMQQYGSKEEASAFVLTTIEAGPLVTMMILGSTGVASFAPHLFVGAVLPFAVGCLLGNLDPDLRDFFSSASTMMIPFFAFALGNTINLLVLGQAGFLGICLGIGVILWTGIPLILADIFIGGGHGGAGLAASSTAGAAATNPLIIGGMIPAMMPIVPTATVLVATSVIVTSIIVPIITAFWCKKFGSMTSGTADAANVMDVE